MAVTVSSAEKRAMIDERFGTPPTPPTTWYAALVKTLPAVGATTLDEPSPSTEYGAYTRVAIANSATNFPPATGDGSKANGIDIVWPKSTGGASSPVSLAYVVLCDTPSGAVSRWIAAAISGGPVSVAVNITPRLATSALALKVNDP